MATGDLLQPLDSRRAVNWVFLVELLICAFLSLFFLFYFNRLVSLVVSYAIRTYTWYAYKADITITSLQISLLGGRIFFKRLKYQAHNETVLIHDGRLTWRYWLRKVQDADVYRTIGHKVARKSDTNATFSREDGKGGLGSSDSESGNTPPQQKLPCRLHLRVSGVEAFLYNHSPSYDHILSELEKAKRSQAEQRPDSGAAQEQSPVSNQDSSDGEKGIAGHSIDRVLTQEITPSDDKSLTSSTRDALAKLPTYLRLFPIQVECKKAAAAVGNENTRSVIVAKAEYAEGRIDAGQAGSLDIFKLLFLFDVNKVHVSLEPNEDFKQTQLNAASSTKEEDGSLPKRRRQFPAFLGRTAVVMRWFRDRFLIKRSTASVRMSPSADDVTQPLERPEIDRQTSWHGLTRFIQDDDNSRHDEWDEVEYAKLTTLADFTSLGLKFFWDIAGPVPSNAEADVNIARMADDANGNPPPEYGLEITFKDGTVNYGPWTDRERIILQAVFFPASLVDASPLPKLNVGQTRPSTVFDMSFIVEGTITVRLPVREPTKDYKWASKAPQKPGNGKPLTGLRRRGHSISARLKGASKNANDAAGKDKRPYGWLDVTVFPDTCVNYKMDMYAREDGFHNQLRVQVKRPQISTSVNHDLLWRSGDVSVTGNLSNPLSWNALRTWYFDIKCADLDLFILRDHMFLLTDVITDWTAGAPPAFHTFVPFKYKLTAQFTNFSLYLNANDANLINRPIDLDDNSYLILRGEELGVDFSIPIEFFRPPTNTFTFDVVTRNLALDIHHPPRLTLHELLQDKRLGQLPHLTLKGSHTANADQSPALVDTLQMEIIGSDLTLTVFGYLLRYFVNFKDNYFGEFLHFRTFEEYQATNGDTTIAIKEEKEKYRYRRSNDLDVILSIVVERPTLLIPSNLYSAKQYLQADLPLANVDLRVTNYYLDLQVDISPISFGHGSKTDGLEVASVDEQLRISDVAVSGHRLFGLPPDEPAYVSTYDISAGDISGTCGTEFLSQAAKAGQAFIFAFDDHENSLPDTAAVIVNDMIFLQVQTGVIRLAIEAAGSQFSLGVDPLDLRFNDAADERASAKLSTRLPNVTVACIQETGQSSGRDQPEASGECLLFLQTTIDLSLLTRKKNFAMERHAQQLHVQQHDRRSRRTRFLYREQLGDSAFASYDLSIDQPAMYLPDLPGNATARNPDTSLRLTSRPPPYPNAVKSQHPLGGQLHGRGALTSPYFGSVYDSLVAPRVLADVPDFHEVSHSDDLGPRTPPGITLEDDREIDNDEVRQTLVINIVPGLRVLVRPGLSEVAISLTKSMIPTLAEDVLDHVQLAVIGKVESRQALRQGMKSRLDLKLSVPSVILRAVTGAERRGPPDRGSRHEIDVRLTRAALALRLRRSLNEASDKTTKILHSSLEDLNVEMFAHTTRGMAKGEPDVHLEVEDALAWSSMADNSTTNLSFKVLSVALNPQRTKQITTAGFDVAEQAIAVQRSAMALDNTLDSRIANLLKFLSDHHNGVSDPLHLSRMTYILRAFPDHLRNQDSWKMLARIRHVLLSLHSTQRHRLQQAVGFRSSGQVKDNTKLDGLLGWSSWDVPAPHESQLYRYVAEEPDVIADPTSRAALQLSLKTGLIRFLVGQGSRGSEVSVADLQLDVSVEPPVEPTGLMLVEANMRTLITVAARSTAAFVRLKWDLLTTAGHALDVYESQTARHPKKPSRPALERLKSFQTPASRDDFHVVVACDDVTTFIDTINLQHVSAIKDLQISVIGTSRAAKSYGDCMSMLVGCNEATTELHSQAPYAGRRIWRTVLTKPGIYVDTRKRLQPAGNEINIGGSYGEVDIAIEQEPIALLGMVDRMLAGEVTQVKTFQERIASLSDPPANSSDPNDAAMALASLDINAGLLAGPFAISFAVLHSLSINVRGKRADLRIKPSRTKDSPLILETDVGPIRFAAISKESGLAGEEALFHTPAVGTSVELSLSSKPRALKLSSTIEEMSIEAQAIQNILTLIRRPEVQSALQALQDGTSDLKRRVGDVFDSTAQASDTRNEPDEALAYSINISLAGFKVTALAPVKARDADSAALAFGLGCIQVVVDNGTDEDKPLLKIPEIYARVDSIYADLDLVGPKKKRPCGHVGVALLIRSKPPPAQSSSAIGDVHITSDALDVEVFSETASTVVDIITHIQQKIVDLDLSKEMDALKKLRPAQRRGKAEGHEQAGEGDDAFTLEQIASFAPTNLVVSLTHLRFAWILTSNDRRRSEPQMEDLELSLAKVEFTLKQNNQAQLNIESLQLQMMPKSLEPLQRSMNSALLPEMIFMVRFEKRSGGICLAFQAVGQIVDFRLDSGCPGPLGLLVESGSSAIDKYREASKNWAVTAKTPQSPAKRSPFGTRKLISLLVDVSFAGGILHLEGKPLGIISPDSGVQPLPLAGQAGASSVKTSLRAPGVAMKLEYLSDESRSIEPSLTSEIKIDASSNTVYPEMVPIILQMSDNVKEAMQHAEEANKDKKSDKKDSQMQKSGTLSLPNDDILKSNELLARTKISLGLRIYRQEFGLSCQPIAKVNAKACIDDIYISVSTLTPEKGDRFLGISACLTDFTASVQHVYSRESTFSFDMESVNIAVMNSKHFGDATAGITAILKIEPMKASVNARQLQDLLLFREIWLPEQIRKSQTPATPAPNAQSDEFLVQRYRQVADAAAFPWNATVFLAEVALDIDFGQSIGKSSASVKSLWASSTKTSGWKQELCVGIEEVSGKSVGRIGGFIDLSDIKVRTFIEWPLEGLEGAKTPLIQAALGFGKLKVKAAFDYQPFAFADFGDLSFIMYNVREGGESSADRLVATLDLTHAYAYITATSSAQAIGLYQAFDRLIQEKQAAFKQSVSDIQKQLHRPSVSSPYALYTLQPLVDSATKAKTKSLERLRTDVMVRVKTINVGVYPGTFFDSQVLKLEAVGGQARFVVDMADDRIHSDLSLIMGQLQVALASAKRMKMPKTLGDIKIEEVIENGVNAKGGTILRVPRLVASMQTWQPPDAKIIDYIFKSTFEGKIDVGWNYSRISFIRTMWNSHTRSLAARLGKPLPESAVRITAGPEEKKQDNVHQSSSTSTSDALNKDDERKEAEEQGKITAVVNMPMSKYEYRALEPPVIETPQLRDMGEATPPLEWIGLQRDKLPNVIHQVVIVTLLELAQEVEDAYGRILGSS